MRVVTYLCPACVFRTLTALPGSFKHLFESGVSIHSPDRLEQLFGVLLDSFEQVL